MGLVAKALASLFGGVSQQPPALRLDNQAELVENAQLSIANGVEKRPNTDFIDVLKTNYSGKIGGHLINRDSNEQYIVMFTGQSGNPIEIFKLDGTPCAVEYTSSLVESNAPSELIANGGFDSDVSNWQEGGATAVWDETTKSCKLSDDGVFAQQMRTLEVGALHTLMADVIDPIQGFTTVRPTTHTTTGFFAVNETNMYDTNLASYGDIRSADSPAQGTSVTLSGWAPDSGAFISGKLNIVAWLNGANGGTCKIEYSLNSGANWTTVKLTNPGENIPKTTYIVDLTPGQLLENIQVRISKLTGEQDAEAVFVYDVRLELVYSTAHTEVEKILVKVGSTPYAGGVGGNEYVDTTFDMLTTGTVTFTPQTETVYITFVNDKAYWTTRFGVTWTDQGSYAGGDSVFSVAGMDDGAALLGTGHTNWQFGTGHVFRSLNTGLTWSDMGRPGNERDIHSIVYLGGGIALAGTGPSGKIVRSINWGGTWTDLGQKFGQTRIYALVNLGGGVVLAGTNPSGYILRSIDSGATWTNIGRLGSEIAIRSLANLGGGVVLAGSASGRIYRSTNFGLNWVDLGQQFGQSMIYGLVSLGNGIALAGTGGNGKILRSVDYGLTWVDLGSQFGQWDIFSFANLGGGVVVASTGPSGYILRSTDLGVTWTNLGQQFGQQNIFALAYLSPDVALAGTQPNAKLLRSGATSSGGQPAGIDNVSLTSVGVFTPDINVANYFVTANPDKAFRAVTIADFTIVANTEKQCRIKSIGVNKASSTALIHVAHGVANQTYKVFINGVEVATYTSTDTVSTYATATIAQNLYNGLVASLGTTNYIFSIEGSSILIIEKNKTPFTMQVTDTWGDAALVGIAGKTQKFTDLPSKVPHFDANLYTVLVEISGDVSNNFDNYYVKWEPKDTVANSPGVWKETDAPELDRTFDAATLPHQIVRTAVNTFTVTPIDWASREVGDDISAPVPSFIGRNIADVFFFKDRLGFLAGENIIFSRASDYFNFWPTTALDVLDDDPIDVAAASKEVTKLYHALPASQALMLFGDRTQPIITAGDAAFTSASLRLDIATNFQMNVGVKPISLGTSIYFATPEGLYSGIREYYVLVDGFNNDAANVTAHVPRYIPKDPLMLVGADAFDMLFVVMPGSQGIYVYRFYWSGDEKVMSAWHHWSFGYNILWAANIEDKLYLIVRDGTEVSLEQISLGETEI